MSILILLHVQALQTVFAFVDVSLNWTARYVVLTKRAFSGVSLSRNAF